MYPQYGNTLSCSQSNRVIDVQFSDEASTEPVTIEQVKAYIRKDFPDDDTNILPDMITAARQWAEKFTGTSIISRTVKAVLWVANRQELPYGPVKDITDKDQYTFQGLDFPRIQGSGEYTFTYTAGYDSVPELLKEAIMARVASMDTHRGDEDIQHYAEIAHNLASQFNRVLWI